MMGLEMAEIQTLQSALRIAVQQTTEQTDLVCICEVVDKSRSEFHIQLPWFRAWDYTQPPWFLGQAFWLAIVR